MNDGSNTLPKKTDNGGSLRILFCGTPDFAVPTLEALIDSPFRPCLVFTQPDRPRGRGQRLVPTPVKRIALEAGIEVRQPERFNDEENLELLRGAEADLAIVIAYSAKIGARALDLVPKGWLNLHPSALPAYRGAAPMQWALAKGETETANTTFFLNEEWDAGPICMQERIEIDPDEDYASLSRRCAESGAELAMKSIRAIAEGTASPTPQDDSLATFAPLIRPDDTRLDWEESAVDIRNKVRGFSPRPGVFARLGDRRVQVLKARVVGEDEAGSDGSPGEIVAAGKGGLFVATGKGTLEPLEVRPQNKAAMSGRDFVNGARLRVGDRFDRDVHIE